MERYENESLVSSSMALKGQKSGFNVRKQFEYLESMIHSNAFTLRDDLYALQEQVNASFQAHENGIVQEHADTCNANGLNDDLKDFRDRIDTFASGLGKEKKIANSYRKQQQTELRSAVDMFTSKFIELENRISSLENDSRLTALASSVTSIENECSKYADLEVRLTEQDSRIADMEKRFSGLNTEVLTKPNIANTAPSFCNASNGFIWDSSCYVLNTTKMNWTEYLTHLSLASLLWDIGKQHSPRCDAAERGVPSEAILFAQRIFIEKLYEK